MKKIITIFLFISIFLGKSNAISSPNNDTIIHTYIQVFNNLSGIFPNEKKVIAIWQFEGENKFNAIGNLHAIVTDAVAKSGRFDVVERDRLDAVLKELDSQAKVEARNSGNYVEQGRILGANYNLIGDIVSIDIVENRNRDKKTGRVSITYDCTILLSFRVVNVETSLVEKTETISAKNGFLSFPALKTEKAAWNKACKKLLTKTEKFIRNAFPKMVSIVQIEKYKKGKVSTILLAGGSGIGIKKKDKVVVYEVTEIEINGEIKERRKEIAKLQVSEVQGENFSICKVKKGGAELYKKINSGATLICKTL